MSIKLSIDSGLQEPPRALDVAGAVITVGRVLGNDVVIADARISSQHGRFVRRGESYTFEDLGSRNGSLVEAEGQRTVLRPHEPVPVGKGSLIRLGDLHAPITLLLVDAPPIGPAGAMGPEGHGATIVAARALTALDDDAPLPSEDRTLRDLFRLLRRVSGRVDAQEVMATLGSEVLNRFPAVRSLTVLLQALDREGWVPEFSRSREGEATRPSRTLIDRAVTRREVVAYIEGSSPSTESVLGIAAAVLMPLLVGDEVIGLLHVEAATGTFTPDDIGYLSVVGTHVAASLACAQRVRVLVREQAALKAENTALRFMPRPILGRSETLLEALRQLERVARTQATVLIQGETGTGKELAARFVHAHSGRAKAQFAPINCGALTESLLESELFGHRKGAFTGAVRDHAGLFEAADGGTVFLDEMGEISPALQVRLLRVLQEREVQPVGASRPVKVDVRIVAATHRDLKAEVAAGRFREDLYYRIAVFPVSLPPLRDRKGDVELLAEQFRQAAVARHGKVVPGFTDEALAALSRCSWPGNIRQLEHEIERAVILAGDAEPIALRDLSGALAPTAAAPGGASLDFDIPRGHLHEVMDQLERRVVKQCLLEHGGNRTRAAVALSISRQALQAKLARWRDLGVALDEGP
ncbi:MAG: FHA domain-containing protein [Myxococcales bacterium]|nr:FHA domain-containing protein [Myxococcales bacterium]